MADSSYQASNYQNQGGDTWTIGGTLNIDSGGALEIAGTDVTSALAAAGSNTGTVVGGAYTATAGDATAHSSDIPTGLSSVTTFLVQVLRSGALVTADAAISELSGTITVADGGATYSVTEGDVMNWIAVGAA